MCIREGLRKAATTLCNLPLPNKGRCLIKVYVLASSPLPKRSAICPAHPPTSTHFLTHILKHSNNRTTLHHNAIH
jgi:hypothetical protein